MIVKALLVTSLTHVSGVTATTRPLALTIEIPLLRVRRSTGLVSPVLVSTRSRVLVRGHQFYGLGGLGFGL